MFKKKINLINEKWEPISIKKVNVIPNISELIFINEQYYMVVNIIHSYKKKIEYFVVIEEYADFKK